MATQSDSDQICCPKVDPAQWEDKVLEWENKPFIKGKVCTFLYMPINFGGAMKKLDKKLAAAGAKVPDWLCLANHTSKWNMDVYLAVDKKIPAAENTTLTGTFYSKVYEGPFKDTGKWCKDYESSAKSRGFNVKKWYMWYTTCPKCAKKYGKNYVVILSQVE